MTRTIARRGNVFRPAWWLPGAHAQTIWGRYARSRPNLPLRHECLRTPDDDNLELFTLPGASDAPHVLLLHGLAGTLRSHYVAGIFGQAQRRGWSATLMLFRGCGEAPNLARRFYHSGETTDLAFAFGTLADRQPRVPWLLAGVSLGGNVLLRWLGTAQERPDKRIVAAAAVSVPFDLEAGARAIMRGFSRIYDWHFLRSLRQKALEKLGRYPDLFDRGALERARSVFDFDDVVTAPVHGFADAHDYYERCSAIHVLERVRVPTLLLAARDDPFLPRQALERAEMLASRNPATTVEIHAHGGHVGFIGGALPWRPVFHAERRVFAFFDAALERRASTGYDSGPNETTQEE